MIEPKFIAIDSSIIGNWARDIYSDNNDCRRAAEISLKQMIFKGWVPVISLHHFEELIRYENESAVENRIRFIESLPQIAWIKRIDGQNCLGSIVDIEAAEIKIYLSEDCSPSENFLKKVRNCFLQIGAPSDIPMLCEWREFRPYMIAMGQRQQVIASLRHASGGNNDSKLLAILKNVDLSTPKVNKSAYDKELGALRDELIMSGDTRLLNQEEIARSFLSDVFKEIAKISQSEKSLDEAFWKNFGLPLNEFQENMTLKDFSFMVSRYHKLSIAAKQLGESIETIWPMIRTHLLPSEEVISEIRLTRENAIRAKGSDLNDDYLASLLPYLDAVVVDRRTYEYLNQAAERKSQISLLMKSLLKASSYLKLIKIL